MYDRMQLKEKAEKARDKKAAIGPDINLDEFDDAPVQHAYLADEDMCALPESDQKRLIMGGMDVTQKDRGGTYFQKDTEVIHCHSQQEGIEVIPIKKALEKYDWVEEYYWKLVAVDADKYTAAAELGLMTAM